VIKNFNTASHLHFICVIPFPIKDIPLEDDVDANDTNP
jgi:hypothetical protein